MAEQSSSGVFPTIAAVQTQHHAQQQPSCARSQSPSSVMAGRVTCMLCCCNGCCWCRLNPKHGGPYMSEIGDSLGCCRAEARSVLRSCAAWLPAALTTYHPHTPKCSHSTITLWPLSHTLPAHSQVLDEIWQIRTDKQFKGKMVVVLAGYEAQIEELLAVNPGLKSRCSERLLFRDFTAGDATELLRQQMAKHYSLELSKEAEQQLPGLMQNVSGLHWVRCGQEQVLRMRMPRSQPSAPATTKHSTRCRRRAAPCLPSRSH